MATLTQKKKRAKSEEREFESIDTNSKNKSKSEEREPDFQFDVTKILKTELKSLTKKLGNFEDEEQLSNTCEDVKKNVKNQKSLLQHEDYLMSMAKTIERLTKVMSTVPKESRARDLVMDIISGIKKDTQESNEVQNIVKLKNNPHMFVNIELKCLTRSINSASEHYFQAPALGRIWKMYGETIQERKDEVVKYLKHIKSLKLAKDDIARFSGSLEEILEELKRNLSKHSTESTAVDRMSFLEECVSEIEKGILNIINDEQEATDDVSFAFEDASPSIRPELDISLEERLRRAHIESAEFELLCPEARVERVVNELHTTYEDALKSAMEYTLDNPIYQGKEWFKYFDKQSTISCTIEKDGLKCDTQLKIEYRKDGNGYVFKLSGINDHSSHQEIPSIEDNLAVESRDEASVQNQDGLPQEPHAENHTAPEPTSTNQQNTGQENHPDIQSSPLIQCQRGIQSIIESFDNEQERLAVIEQFKLNDLQNLVKEKFLAEAGKVLNKYIFG